ncbi:hypothetical protein L208DRAFT_1382119 [Tricholoma matsutake]|nr:hypothetical protein L208DRAFT_1382119 [Tricholoma matsutake 945]
MPPRATKLVHLVAPLQEFKIPFVLWHPSRVEFSEFQEKWWVTYGVPTLVQICGKEWYRIAAYNVKNELEGIFLLPPKYHALWRRLIYGALYHEKMYEAWNKKKRLRRKDLNVVEREMLRLRKNAGVQLAQYLLCQCLVLEELSKLRFDNDNVVIQTLVEFGIRESHDWLFENFEHAKKAGACYLSLDPTEAKNKKEFVERVPMAMTNESFQQTKWLLKSSSHTTPEQWNEYASDPIIFFSDYFLEFLQQEEYIHWYTNKVDHINNSDVLRVEIDHELVVVLGDQYDKRVQPLLNQLGDSLGLEEFTRLLIESFANEFQGLWAFQELVKIFGPRSEAMSKKLLDDLAVDSSGQSHASWDIALGEAIECLCELKEDQPGKFSSTPPDVGMGGDETRTAQSKGSGSGLPAMKSLPEGVEQMLQVFRQPDSGLEVIFGPGFEAISTKLLDDLAVDPSGESHASWAIAIEEAINQLNELKSAQHGEKGNEKGSGEPSPDIEMQDEARTLKQKLSTTADEEGEQDRQTAIETYQQMKNFHLLS